MKRILITGMSGVGKSSVIVRLAALGYKAVDLDDPEYSELVDFDDAHPNLAGGATQDWRWRADLVERLLETEDADVLFVSGTSSNMSRFYPRFDRVVLLTAPDAVMTRRLATRTNNPYGKRPHEVTRQLALRPLVEPLLRRAAHAVIDTSVPLDDVVAKIVQLAGETRRP